MAGLEDCIPPARPTSELPTARDSDSERDALTRMSERLSGLACEIPIDKMLSMRRGLLR